MTINTNDIQTCIEWLRAKFTHKFNRLNAATCHIKQFHIALNTFNVDDVINVMSILVDIYYLVDDNYKAQSMDAFY